MPHNDLAQEALLLKLNRVEGLEPLKALEGMSGQTKLYVKLVKSFALEQQGRAEELLQLHDAQDWEVLRRRCHSLKSYAAYVGAYNIADQCADAEEILAKGTIERTPIETISSQLNPVVNQMQALVDEIMPTTSKPQFSLLQLKKNLIDLLPLLQQSDFAAEEALKNLISMTEGTEFQSKINEIFDSVDDVEYELAVEQTTKLLDVLV